MAGSTTPRKLLTSHLACVHVVNHKASKPLFWWTYFTLLLFVLCARRRQKRTRRAARAAGARATDTGHSGWHWDKPKYDGCNLSFSAVIRLHPHRHN